MANDVTIPESGAILVNPDQRPAHIWYRTLKALIDGFNNARRELTSTEDDVTTLQTNVATNTTNIATLNAEVAILQEIPAYQHVTYATNTTISGTIPYDDTIPQIGEGTEILTLSITPVRANSVIRVHFAGQGGVVTAGPLTAALFINGAANAVQAAVFQTAATGTEYDASMEYSYAPGSTSAQTIAVRVGSNSGNSFMNGIGVGTRRYGGAAASTLTAQEIWQ